MWVKRKSDFKEEELLSKIQIELCPGTKGNLGISNYEPYGWDFFLFPLEMRYVQAGHTSLHAICLISERKWLVALRSVVKKIGPVEESYTYDPEFIRQVVEFYLRKLGFPTKDSEEFKEMFTLLQRDALKFYLTSDAEQRSSLKI
ncbi:uncharacterized protein LOC114527002 isoform X2 [Dendronephthya gigantea]|uniref:uncharacterized protein LOC114527002 isoform X2 n=1 Tax=Dendronephthya gigantea TaxID=151771 RepID=UPI0010693728|nr:uncharacterized protein LOC114527002 isoform X2 [Dendronephthya gigantea]